VSPVVTLNEVHSIMSIAETLATTTHSAFPVNFVRGNLNNNAQTFMGTISRDTLYELIKAEGMLQTEEEAMNATQPVEGPTYEEIDEFKRHFHRFDEAAPAQLKRIQENHNGKYAGKFLDLAAYVNTSATTVQTTMAVGRTYVIFRSMGLRHLTVLDRFHQVAGILTRKDLMGFKIEKKIEKAIENATGKTFEHLHDHHGHGGGPDIVGGVRGAVGGVASKAGAAVEMAQMGVKGALGKGNGAEDQA